MPPTRSSATSRSGRDSTSATLQPAFRDVTNSYLNANKENIPPGYLGSVTGAVCFLEGNCKDGGNGISNVCSADVCTRGIGSQLGDTVLCGTPARREWTRTKNETVSGVVDSTAGIPAAGTVLFDGPVGTHSLNGPSAEVAAAQSPLTPMMTPRVWASGGSALTAGGDGDDSSLSVMRTPGHNSAYHSAYQNSNTSYKLLQQRQCTLSAPRSADTSAVAATPNPTRQRPLHVPKAASHVLPQYAPSHNVGSTPGGRTSGIQREHPSSTRLASQSPLLCTPNGDRLSAVTAAVSAAAFGGRGLLDTPTRMEDIPLFFNSFESGSETPMGESPAGAGYSASQMTPHRTYDLQMAVEEMLRNCVDNFTPAKGSDASGGIPHRFPQSPRQPQTTAALTASINDSVTPERVLPFTGTDIGGRCGLHAWAPAMIGCAMLGRTPERLTAPQGAFAENDEEDASATPQSHRTVDEMSCGGVRIDPMVYFSTAAGGAAKSSGAPPGVTHRDAVTAANSIDRLNAAFGACGALGESPPNPYLSHAHSGVEPHCGNDNCSQTDLFITLAAAVQLQGPQHLHYNSSTRPQSVRSKTESAELSSRTASEWNADTTTPQQSMPPPPSYAIAARQQNSPHPMVEVRPDFSLASTGAAVTRRHPTRRTSHIPQVKAAAGSLIAVGGRRVPVDKLHLLAIGNEPSPSVPPSLTRKGASSSPSSRGDPGGRSLSPSAASNHVERPSMRRVPKPSVVTVTRTAAAGADDEAVSVSPSCNAPAAKHRGEVKHPTSSRACVSEPEPTNATHGGAGPSVRRVPPTMTTRLRYGSGGAVAGVVPRNAVSIGDGAQESGESDVVAVLQFSKGQRMCFLANISTATLEKTKGAVARDRDRCKRSSAVDASSSLASRALLTSVEVGKTYLAHVFAEGSPHEGVSYEDTGVCVQLITHTSSLYSLHVDRVNGILLRVVDIVMNADDRCQHERVLLQQTTAYIECERHLKFSSLPLQLETIYFTFDGSVCVVFYRFVTQEGEDRSLLSSISHRHPSMSRLVRELQLHLNCRVFLKQG